MASVNDVQQLYQLLNALNSNTNEQRNAAEQALNGEWLEKKPVVLFTGFCKLIRETPDLMVRMSAAVILRRLAGKDLGKSSHWHSLPADCRQSCQVDLLASLCSESNPAVRRKISDTVSEIARLLAREGTPWPELLQTVLSCSKSPQASQREAAYYLISSFPDMLDQPSIESIKGAFEVALQDGELTVRLAALKASVRYIVQFNPKPKQLGNEIIGLVLQVTASIPLENSEDLSDALESLIELGQVQAKIFRTALPELTKFCVSLMKNEDLDDGSRQLALELLVTLAEYAPAMCRKLVDFAGMLVPVCLEWMAQVPDESDWYTTDVLEEDDNDEHFVVAEQSLDRLARSLGGKSFSPVCFNYIPSLLQSPQWTQRHAGLMAISAIGEGCYKTMQPELQKMVQLVVPYFADPHPRVRYATCNCIGQMCTDFGPDLQHRFHEPILSALVPAMDDTSQPRVQAHAAAALVNFSEGSSKADIEPYLDHILQRLLKLLQTGRVYLQEQAITSIATIADSAEDHFVRYYDQIMPLLVSILESPDREFRLLRGKAMECATLIALAIGKEVFSKHAAPFMALLQKTQQSIVDDDDPQSSYLLSAWARLCKVLGQDFVPYLDVVMPPLLKSAQLSPDFVILEGDEEIGEQYSEENGWEFTGYEGQKFGLKTAVLDEKCTAVEMLVCYIRELGPGFAKYAPKVLEIVVPQLKFWFSDGVREAAALAVPLLFRCFKASGASNDWLVQNIQRVIGEILGAMALEPEDTQVVQLLACFYQTLEIGGMRALTPELMEKFVSVSLEELKEFHERFKERQESRADDDHDQEQEEDIRDDEEEDEVFLSELSHAVHAVFEAHGSSFLPAFERVVPFVLNAAQSADPVLQQWAYALMDDVIEFGGPPAVELSLKAFTPALLQGLNDPATFEVKQTCAYGVGIMAQFGGELYDSVVEQAIPLLGAIIFDSRAQLPENVMAKDNAVSALGKIAHFAGVARNKPQLLDKAMQLFFRGLPILVDEQEVSHSYGFLFDLIEQQHQLAQMYFFQDIPHLYEIFAELISSDILNVAVIIPLSSSLMNDPAQIGNTTSAFRMAKVNVNLVPRSVAIFNSIISQISDPQKAQLASKLSAETRKILEEKGVRVLA